MAIKKKTAKRKAKRLPAKRSIKKTKPTTRKAKAKRKSTIVHKRPLVTAEEKLYLLFKEDYEARQIFTYLRVETVGELEQYAPKQIIDILSRPLQQTVHRIRSRLAEKYRCLSGDDEFLASAIAANGEK